MQGPDRRRLAVAGVLVFVAFGVGRFSAGGRPPALAVERAVFRAAGLTSPYLEAQGAENADPSLLRTRSSVLAYIAERRSIDPTLRVSVYVRDLDNGPWIGIDDRALYLPASLTKVVVLIRTLQREEEEGGVLDHEIVFPGAESMAGDDTMLGAPDSLRLEAGEHYSIRDLLGRMIEYSDNHAYELVLQGAGRDGVSRMLYDLSADQSVEDGKVYFDAHTVATLLRSLYYRSFLSRRHSELALELLTRSRFSEGLRRYLPPDALVASKYGFYDSIVDGRPQRELHECGIVYRPRSPYVMCVMTATGRARHEELGDIIGRISRIVWAQ